MDFLNAYLPGVIQAFSLIYSVEVLLYLLLGVVMGLGIGIFPGLGGIAGLSLVLPFMFGMDPISGLALMIGMIAVVPTSDTFASVLMGIPGSSASQATVLDGFPLSKKGEAARALSAAFSASLFGGIVGAVFLTFFIVLARPIILAFGLPEMLMVTVLGLSMVAVLSGRVALKGLAAACLGLLVGTIGEADAGGSLRMATYDIPYIADGFTLVIVGLGIFALPEIIALLRSDRAISTAPDLGAGWVDGVKDWWRNKWLSVRCAIVGVIVGVIPGLGGSVVDWIAYGHTVQTTKDKSTFGKGEIRGVIGPESSNNAKEGGGLVPTLIFGIPGSGSMAIFIGAVALLGSGDIELGPQMLSAQYLDMTYSIIWLLALANVFGTILCIGLSGGIARLTIIRFTVIAPVLFMLITFAAFQSGQSLGDLLALAGFGVLGILLRRFDWSRPAFLIGFILSNPAETFSNQAYQVAMSKFKRGFDVGIEYIFSPLVIFLIILTVISVVLGIKQAKKIRVEGDVKAQHKVAPTLFVLVVNIYFVISFFDASRIPDILLSDKIFPMFVAAVGIVCTLVLLFRMQGADRDNMMFADREKSADAAQAQYGLWHTLSLFAGLLLLTALLGFVLALVLGIYGFMRWRAKWHSMPALVYAVVSVVCICFMAYVLHRDFPAGIVQFYVDLPWPFR